VSLGSLKHQKEDCMNGRQAVSDGLINDKNCNSV